MIPLQTTITILATIYQGQGVIARWEGVTTQGPKSGSMNRTLYWVNTRELDRELFTK